MKLSINKLVLIFIGSDITLNAAFGLVGPIFAIFLVQNIKGADVSTAGIAAAIYWILKSILQIPISIYLDRNKGEGDDFKALITGILVASLVPIGYLLSSKVWHIFLIQTFFACAMSLVVPSWYAIYTRHIDKGKESFEWALDSTSLGIAAGITGAIGGLLAKYFGFSVVFLIVSFLTLIGAINLLLAKKYLYIPEEKPKIFIPPKDHIK